MVALFVSILAAGVGPVDADLRAVLDATELGFCSDPEYPLTAEEARWCDADLSTHCPTFTEACEAGNRADVRGLPGRYASREGTGKQTSDRAPTGDPVEEPAGGGEAERTVTRDVNRKKNFEFPDLSGVARVFFWFIIVGFSIGLIIALIQLAKGARRPPKPVLEEAPERLEVDTPQHVLVTESDRLWRAAEQAASLGDHDAALQLGHRAVLAALHNAGHIRLHRSRTNGEYLRDLRPVPGLRKDVRDLVHTVERVQFGDDAADDTRWAHYATAARALLTRLSAVMLVFALGLSQPGCGGSSFSWSESPSGASVFMALANRLDRPTSYREAPLKTLVGFHDHGANHLLLLRDARPTEAEWAIIEAWVKHGGRLFDASGTGENPLVDYELVASPGPPLIHDVADPFLYFQSDVERYEIHTAVLCSRGVVSTTDERATDVLAHEGGASAVRFTMDEGAVFIFDSDLLFTNASMVTANNAAVALDLFSAPWDVRIEVLDSFFWAGVDSPTETATSSEMTPLMLHLLLALALFALWRGVHFGKPRNETHRGRRSWAEHVEALGRQYARANDAGHALQLYSRWALDVLGARAGGEREMRGHVSRISAASGEPSGRVADLLTVAQRAAAGDGPAGDEAAMTLDSLSRLVNKTSAGPMTDETSNMTGDRR